MVPPGGWSVTIEGAGPTIRSDNFSDFIRQVSLRLQANGLDKHGWREEALDLMCRQRPDIPCIDLEVNQRSVTIDDVRRFVKTMMQAREDGAQAVSAEEQDRRGAICLQCPKRGYVTCMGGCGAFVEAVVSLTLSSQARLIPELHKSSCMACGCELSVLTMFPLDVIHAVDKKLNFQASEYDPRCWKLELPTSESAKPLGEVLNSTSQPPVVAETFPFIPSFPTVL